MKKKPILHHIVLRIPHKTEKGHTITSMHNTMLAYQLFVHSRELGIQDYISVDKETDKIIIDFSQTEELMLADQVLPDHYEDLHEDERIRRLLQWTFSFGDVVLCGVRKDHTYLLAHMSSKIPQMIRRNHEYGYMTTGGSYIDLTECYVGIYEISKLRLHFYQPITKATDDGQCHCSPSLDKLGFKFTEYVAQVRLGFDTPNSTFALTKCSLYADNGYHDILNGHVFSHVFDWTKYDIAINVDTIKNISAAEKEELVNIKVTKQPLVVAIREYAVLGKMRWSFPITEHIPQSVIQPFTKSLIEEQLEKMKEVGMNHKITQEMLSADSTGRDDMLDALRELYKKDKYGIFLHHPSLKNIIARRIQSLCKDIFNSSALDFPRIIVRANASLPPHTIKCNYAIKGVNIFKHGMILAGGRPPYIGAYSIAWFMMIVDGKSDVPYAEVSLDIAAQMAMDFDADMITIFYNYLHSETMEHFYQLLGIIYMMILEYKVECKKIKNILPYSPENLLKTDPSYMSMISYVQRAIYCVANVIDMQELHRRFLEGDLEAGRLILLHNIAQATVDSLKNRSPKELRYSTKRYCVKIVNIPSVTCDTAYSWVTREIDSQYVEEKDDIYELSREYRLLLQQTYCVSEQDIQLKKIEMSLSAPIYVNGKLDKSYINETLQKYPPTWWLRMYKSPEIFYKQGYSQDNHDPGYIGWLSRTISKSWESHKQLLEKSLVQGKCFQYLFSREEYEHAYPEVYSKCVELMKELGQEGMFVNASLSEDLCTYDTKTVHVDTIYNNLMKQAIGKSLYEKHIFAIKTFVKSYRKKYPELTNVYQQALEVLSMQRFGASSYAERMRYTISVVEQEVKSRKIHYDYKEYWQIILSDSRVKKLRSQWKNYVNRRLLPFVEQYRDETYFEFTMMIATRMEQLRHEYNVDSEVFYGMVWSCIHERSALSFSNIFFKYTEFKEFVLKKIEEYSSAFYHDYPAIHSKKSEQMYQVQIYSGEIYFKSHYCGKIVDGYYLPDGIYTITFMKDSIRIYNPVVQIIRAENVIPIVKISQSDSLAMNRKIQEMREKYTKKTYPVPTIEGVNVLRIGAWWWANEKFAHIVCMSNEKKYGAERTRKYAFRLTHCPSRQYAMMVGIIKMLEMNEYKEVVIHTSIPRLNNEKTYPYLSREWLESFEKGEVKCKDEDIARDMLTWMRHIDECNMKEPRIMYHKTHKEEFFKEIYDIIQLINIPVYSSYKLSPMYLLE